MDELLERLRSVQRLHDRTDSDGERESAAAALDAIKRRLAEEFAEDDVSEFQFSMADGWSKRLFIALLKRYGIRPYRYRGQRRTTVMARVSQSFLDDTLWPQFNEMSEVLRRYLNDVTERVIQAAVYDGDTELAELAPGALEAPKRPK